MLRHSLNSPKKFINDTSYFLSNLIIDWAEFITALNVAIFENPGDQ